MYKTYKVNQKATLKLDWPKKPENTNGSLANEPGIMLNEEVVLLGPNLSVSIIPRDL